MPGSNAVRVAKPNSFKTNDNEAAPFEVILVGSCMNGAAFGLGLSHRFQTEYIRVVMPS